MASNLSEMGWNNLPLNKWTEEDVSSWLQDIGVKQCYIDKLKDEEVTGPVLIRLQNDFLKKTIGMKSGQIELLLRSRELLLKSPEKISKSEINLPNANQQDKIKPTSAQGLVCEPQKHDESTDKQSSSTQYSETAALTDTLTWCEYRKFDEDEKDCRYIKHSLLPPETGSENLLVACHEYKSLEIAQKLDSKRLQVKVASEVLRFACGCMNMRANGTIHFGVMDKVKGTYKHGEVIGIDVRNREDFVDALDYIEKCFKGSNQQCDARNCIRNPRFIEVLEKEMTKNSFVVEYDVVPKAMIIKDRLYSVGLPKFNELNEKDQKVKLEATVPYHRVGANTPKIPEDDLVRFIQSLKEKDQQREEAESMKNQTTVDFRQDQKRKLSILLTFGKKRMDNSLFYIIVTNRFDPQHLENITFLVNMNTFCVFDFDPDSMINGLCGTFKKQKAVIPHFLNDYLNEEDINLNEFSNKLGLFENTSWIFCNGRNGFHQIEETCDEKTWIKMRRKKLTKAVSLICNELLPRKSFVVLFLLMSDVQQPIVETFSEFYSQMNGHESLVVIADSKENYKKWSSLAQVFCPMSTLEEISVTGMPLSHLDATVQSIQLSKNQTTRTLPVLNGGVCSLKSADEAMLHSLEILSVDQCENINLDIMDEEEIKQMEKNFYHGCKVGWINFWLADKHKCGDIIKRDAYKETNAILGRLVSCTKATRPIESINIYHHPGSGGSTVARQILWTWKNRVRCAVVKHLREITTVCEHAVKLREHDERDQNNCLPVLLLLEDQNTDNIDNLRRELRNVITTKNITSSAVCFILLICNRSNDPETTICKMSPSQTVAVTHKLSDDEKPMFSKKREELKLQFDADFILTFVLMSEGFERNYIEDFVRNILYKIDHASLVTRLIRFVALLNTYVEDSHMSVSHCEASLGIATYIKRVQQYAFVDSLSDEAKLLFIHLRENATHLSSIRIIHKLIAEELLKQMSTDVTQSAIAKDLITDKVLINHKFGREEFVKFIKALFIRRNKKSRGDFEDTAFSPLIEHITKTDGIEKAIHLMKAVYDALGKDGIVAQQLARLLYTNQRFEEALKWAEEAKSCCPYNTFVLDTLGQVYKWWFYHLFDSLQEEEPSPERGVEIISTALKGISAFQASENAAQKEKVSFNSSPYYGEVDVSCRLLKFLSIVDIFSNKTGKSLLMEYLLTEYIPENVKKPWQKFHLQLKGLQHNLELVLECISEDLSFFQTDVNEEDEELDARDPEQLYKPREWLTRKSKVYADFFCNTLGTDIVLRNENTMGTASALNLSQFQRQMMTYKLGGGNVTSIMTLIYHKDTKKSEEKLEQIVSMYKSLTLKNLEPKELAHFIFCQIALNCTKPGSSELMSLQQLQDLCKSCIKKGKTVLSATAPFLVSLLLWPETDNALSYADSQVLLSAIDNLQRFSEQKMEQVVPRKRRTVDHFYYGKARGLNKIVHKSVIEKQIKGTVTERREKWFGGEVWKTSKVTQLLKRVDGWTENGRLFVKCGDSKIRVFPRYSASLPLGNENVTFYLGFSFSGVVAADIQIKEAY